MKHGIISLRLNPMLDYMEDVIGLPTVNFQLDPVDPYAIATVSNWFADNLADHHCFIFDDYRECASDAHAFECDVYCVDKADAILVKMKWL
jgi:hypothetical protein